MTQSQIIPAQVFTSATGLPIIIHEHHPALGFFWAVSVFAAVVIAAAVGWWVWRARKIRAVELELERRIKALEESDLRARALEEADWRDELAERRHRRLEISARMDAGIKTAFDAIERRAQQTNRAIYERMIEVSRREIPPSIAPPVQPSTDPEPAPPPDPSDRSNSGSDKS